ncbi:uncharacterized protein L969DRAFT_95417 [Mixia osmundae IAM 14324]|uniref:non-specific serine/threonine protein kinase n=1 Tax=Mixia osmundae (strain CBS 9802 / IAM 14324 / JCM 22182 / KY 12970) TaxID=764103 RepID=G7E0F9_MIXOS|nr:uncharacterized protein L969DRAFT_95417 [Mixia osmundae IAM 14324]KEI38328.1 hypothetical protein L969DRAFT_95417 [Mixia osmundae IAM 14324]GAA96319.1 hypothetical protein E5Q_02985 [Mixia osmundae IAM 14324]
MGPKGKATPSQAAASKSSTAGQMASTSTEPHKAPDAIPLPASQQAQNPQSGGSMPHSPASAVMSNAESTSVGSVFTDDEEKMSDYEKGGYHPVYIGETFSNGRYVVVRKLGFGHFSTVWLARDNKENKHVALKVVKSASHYRETAIDEIKLLQKVVSSDPRHPGRRHVVSLLDHFNHEGPNGSHVCMVFEVLGENLLGLIKRYQNRGVPEHIVKQISRQVLLGLDYMHRSCGIIHTDLKPENVLICIEDVEAVVRAELETSPAAVPTKLVGVPPSQGRGGAQTPRGEGIFIIGSQPLPSPSSSFGTSPGMDKLGFAMSKISDDGSASGASGPASRMSSSSAHDHSGADGLGKGLDKVQLDGGSDWQKTEPAHHSRAGPSLLSQMAPGQSQSPATPGSPASPGDDKMSISGTSAVSHPSPPSALPDTPNRPAPAAGDPSTLPPNAPYDPSTLERITVKIADLGNASWTDYHFTSDIQTRQYRSPEAILGAPWGTTVDMWSAACMIFELLTGDYLFDPAAGSRYNKDDDHMAQMIELLGPMPRHIALAGKFSTEIFNRKGELRHIHKLKRWPLESVLMEKYLINEDDAEHLRSFLEPMLNFHPDKRAPADVMIKHTWLEGIMVAGEMEAVERERSESAPVEVPEVVMNSDHTLSAASARQIVDLHPDAADALKPLNKTESPAGKKISPGGYQRSSSADQTPTRSADASHITIRQSPAAGQQGSPLRKATQLAT